MSRYQNAVQLMTGALAVGFLSTPATAAQDSREAAEEATRSDRDAAPATSAQDSAEVAEETRPADVGEIIVTARRREESLQRVPDAVTVFTSSEIESAGIREIADFAALTPNMTLQQGTPFKSGRLNLSMRGIGNGQEGSPSVSFLVDGIPAESTDSINSGSLEDIQRIEILRGPQSALYGFNAIAGAINIITKRPSNERTFGGRALYGKGPNREIGAVVSGPLVKDTLLFRLAGTYRNDEGLFTSPTNGLQLDSKNQKQVRARLLFTPVTNLEIDLRATHIHEKNGATYQEKIPSIAFLDDFSDEYRPRRGFPGVDERKQYNLGAKIEWDFGAVALISLTGYNHLDQDLDSSFCYDDPSDPVLPQADGSARCFLGNAYGSSALAGQTIDEFFASADDFRTLTQDLRLESRGSGPVQWTVGGALLRRRAFQGFDAGRIVAPAATRQIVFPAWNQKKDEWWGLYGQLIWTPSERWELSAAARYDDETYENTSYTDRSKTAIRQVRSADGELIDTQRQRATAFQPKGQISYRFTPDVMGYVTISRGFRAGFFNTGNFTRPENTTNYEVGAKSTLFNRRLLANVSVFHVDYSNQQFSRIIAIPPFRTVVSIPKTKIDGAEIELTAVPSRMLRLGLNLGYLDAKVSDGTRSPASPKYNVSANADLSVPISESITANLYADARYNSSLYLSTGNTQRVPPKTYFNLRAGLGMGHYKLTAYIKNLTNERQATIAGFAGAGGFVRFQNDPRTYGLELNVGF